MDTTEYEEAFVGEVELLHFENSREALAKQSARFDEPQLLEMSPKEIKNFLLEWKFDLSQEGAVVIKSFDHMSSWESYYFELSYWLSEGQISNEEPIHPDVICYPTSYLREI
jgi:hypothetical protein